MLISWWNIVIASSQVRSSNNKVHVQVGIVILFKFQWSNLEIELAQLGEFIANSLDAILIIVAI